MGRVLVNGQVKWTTKIIAVSRFFLSLFIWMWWDTTKSGNKQSESGKLNGHETIQSNQSDSFGTWNWAVVERMGRYTQYRQKQLILNQWLFISFTRFCSFFCSEEKKNTHRGTKREKWRSFTAKSQARINFIWIYWFDFRSSQQDSHLFITCLLDQYSNNINESFHIPWEIEDCRKLERCLIKINEINPKHMSPSIWKAFAWRICNSW